MRKATAGEHHRQTLAESRLLKAVFNRDRVAWSQSNPLRVAATLSAALEYSIGRMLLTGYSAYLARLSTTGMMTEKSLGRIECSIDWKFFIEQLPSFRAPWSYHVSYSAID